MRPRSLGSVQDLETLREELHAEKVATQTTVIISSGTCGVASGSLDVVRAFEEEMDSQGVDASTRVRVTGCHGYCEQEPMVILQPAGTVYCRVAAKHVPEIVSETLVKGEVVEALLYRDPATGEPVQKIDEIPFYRSQDRAILDQNWAVDPREVGDYLAAGGYSALAKVLTSVPPENVIEEVMRSGLRGRGGGGYPTGLKWRQCREAAGDVHYVICNADEGDPGAYMDRAILEGNPHLVLEGMIIGAWAIGSTQGYVYVRNEYPLALKHIIKAVEDARTLGLLGEDVLGTGFRFDVQIARGGGAFICGESTALMASLEGKVGEPRPKDIHTVEQGLWDQPSNLNNVESWANVPSIILNGGDWFAAKGTERSKGTKIFALTGQIQNTGLVEVAMGTPLSTIIHDIGGGPLNGGTIKAVQTGGPSGGCLPTDLFHLPVDYEALTEAGSMVGSGGMVVMDEGTCMVEVARYFLQFLQGESCGKCVPCRVGVDRMLEIVTDIVEGRGNAEKLGLLEDLADTISVTSLCALGKTAPNPVLSTLQYFRSEYEAHVNEGRCPAGVCRDLITFHIAAEKCTGCVLCLVQCPEQAITGEKKEPHVIDPELCNRCGICRDVCDEAAVLWC